MKQILADPLFRAAIFIASPIFYQKISKNKFDIARLSAKEKLTLWKYMNRATYRPTPFGLFASISSCYWSTLTDIRPADDGGLWAHIAPDQRFTRLAGEKLLNVMQNQLLYEANPTLYLLQRNYRFIRTEINQEQKRIYRLQSVRASSVIRDLFKFCRNGRAQAVIIQRIMNKARCTDAVATDYFAFLRDTQLLLPVHRATINGKDHLQWLMQFEPKDGQASTELERLLALFGKQRLPLAGQLKGMNGELDLFLNQKDQGDQKTGVNITLQRELAAATLSSDYQEMIKAGLFALNCLCPTQDIDGLRQFTQQFQRHFEGQRIPLLQALDPERGIAYQDMASSSQNPLLETLNIYRRNSHADPGEWHTSHAFLLQRWLAMEKNGEQVIMLDQEDLENLQPNETTSSGPGFSVLFRIAGDTLFLESAGGANGPAMLARFTVTDPQIAASAKEMARQVEALNPNIIFAELLHLSDPHTDNINRREKIWAYEIPLTAAAQSHPDTQTLRLDDLFIEIKAQRIMLWSKTNNKYVIPRMTSAYNHSIDQLPVFRFLADLSYQYGVNHLHFALADHFPGLISYPRVSYGRTIISLATWIFSNTQLQDILQADDPQLPELFGRFATTYRLPPVFSLSEGDQQLVFFRDDPEDVCFFRASIRSKETVKLMEFLIPGNEVVSRDPDFRSYLNQFNAYLIPSIPMDLPRASNYQGRPNARRKFIPGSEWLYLKIYLPHLSADRILLKIWPLLKKRYVQGKIRQWFFIRYEDPAPHLRLRIKLDPLEINAVLVAFRSLLDDHIQEQVIREYQLDTYDRELERYFAGGIEATERFFAASSNFVMSYLSAGRRRPLPPVHLTALVSTQKLLDHLLPEDHERISYLKSSYEGLASEFEGQQMKYEMDLKFRNFRQAIDAILSQQHPFGPGVLERAFRTLIHAGKTLKPAIDKHPEDRAAYIQSILHMHLNRVFTDQQRKQEMLIYYLLYKWHIGRQAKR
ncbi:lantibiotic dehydratase [Mucilaginibacter hurinus]|nr:lantibiotic dehydratase [Mucilaginibacter hurinus]